MRKRVIFRITAALLAVLFSSSCMSRDISIEDLSSATSRVTLTCMPTSLNLNVGETADISVEVSGAGKSSPVRCLSSDSDIAEAYEVDTRTLRVKGVTVGKATVSVTCESSDAVKVEVTVAENNPKYEYQ